MKAPQATASEGLAQGL